ncbi:hypothetical protein ABDI30_24500 [Paenibacillus cisolokensis]|uniref:hypothetical protein n=1 Tax=Paenibacillus cisolokensis TaxID=1658519 RepID=UPI003D27CF4B
MGLPTAKEWNENAELYLITSIEETDLEKEKNYTAGLDGKRRFWNMIFAVPGTSKSIIITIHDKEIVNKLEAMNEFSSRELVYMDDIHFDSTELVKKIEGSNSIVPGNTWIRGYHFNLSRSGDKTVLGIVGLNPNDDIKLSRISFDVKRGTLIN